MIAVGFNVVSMLVFRVTEMLSVGFELLGLIHEMDIMGRRPLFYSQRPPIHRLGLLAA